MSYEKGEIINIWDKVASNFGKEGPKYWDNFGKRLVQLSNIKQGSKVLDMGMGRGASLFPAIDKVGFDGCVIGIDSSEAMVTETHKDILSRNILNAEVKYMDAVKLNFDDNYFDNVICGFGIGYLLLSENKLNGVWRVLKNNGQVSFSIWGKQEDQKWLTEIIDNYLQIERKNDEKSSQIPKFDTIDDVIKILNDAGFHNIKVYEENSAVVYKNKEEWWQEMCSNAVRNIFDQIEGLGCKAFKEFKDEVFNGLQKYYNEAGICFNMPVIYALGEKSLLSL